MSQTPPNKQGAAASTHQAVEKETKGQISDAQLEKITGGSNVQGSRLEETSNQTIGQPENLSNPEEIST